MRSSAVATLALLALLACVSTTRAAERKTENVFLITTDGLRWQEVFRGADESLLNKEAGGIEKPEDVRKEFWRDTPARRREALMPFFWSKIAKDGQIYGNQDKGSVAHITNTMKFSYPGYNEILTGKADPAITSNAAKPNENLTVLEWLNGRDGFKGRVAAFSAWRIMPFIYNRDRCGFPVFGGWEPVPDKDPNPRQQLLNDLLAEITPSSPGEAYDALVYEAAVEHLKRHKPRVMHFSFLETDHWAHSGRYDNVLRAAHSYDGYVRKLWELAQSMPEYKDKTTFVLVTDHGRGSGTEQWKHHGQNVDGAENIWMAFMGPDTPALGERANVAPVTQSQIAATIGALLGEDYHAAVPGSGAPVADAVKR
jgi:hypothetical protein